jgi:gluconolactonase
MKTLRHALFGLGAALLGAGAAAQQLLPGERNVRVSAIDGVVADGARWRRVWTDYETADGIVGTRDGGLLFAQEQTDSVRKLGAQGGEGVHVSDAYGVGAVSLDAEERLFAVERTCTEPLNPELATCEEPTRVVQLLPERRVLATAFADGRPLGRLNDLIADGMGGAFFTSGGAYHVTAEGIVTTVAENDLRSNGIMLSPDGTALYVTNNTEVLAFAVAPEGTTSNRRVFAVLDGDSGADGMAVDAEGRLYVTANEGVHVIAADGDYLGLIPTPRRPITLAFSGPRKRTLYAPSMGAVGPDGQPWTTPEGVRNTAMTIYAIELVAEGYDERPK